MEFVHGERMDHRIKRLGKIPETEMILIMLRLLAAETHIYSRGYLYRDMKPQNVILNDRTGAVLFDFGICVSIEAALDDSANLIAGTPMYFPPERLTGEGESAAGEIYSLGMVLYHGITGRNYFTNRELEAMAAKETLPAMLLNKNKMDGIPNDLAEVITRMIQRHPKKRYQRFIEVERELLRLLWVRVKRLPPQELLSVAPPAPPAEERS
jgi:serine/threonine-protein kinase